MQRKNIIIGQNIVLTVLYWPIKLPMVYDIASRQEKATALRGVGTGWRYVAITSLPQFVTPRVFVVLVCVLKRGLMNMISGLIT